MNPNTYKLCRKCKSEYPHYNSGFTKCNNCPSKIIEDEKESNLNRGLRNVAKRSLKRSKIKSERIGNNLYRLTSEPRGEVSEIQSKKEAYRIPKTTSKQKKINSQLASLKKARIELLGSSCEACGIHCNVQYSHHTPRSLRGDLELDPDNACLLCWQCHFRFEHLLEPKEVLKFKNLETILDYLWNNDKKRYYHVTDLLKIEQLT